MIAERRVAIMIALCAAIIALSPVVFAVKESPAEAENRVLRDQLTKEQELVASMAAVLKSNAAGNVGKRATAAGQATTSGILQANGANAQESAGDLLAELQRLGDAISAETDESRRLLDASRSADRMQYGTTLITSVAMLFGIWLTHRVMAKVEVNTNNTLSALTARVQTADQNLAKAKEDAAEIAGYERGSIIRND